MTSNMFCGHTRCSAYSSARRMPFMQNQTEVDISAPLAGVLAGYMTRPQLARDLEVVPKTLDRWDREGRGPRVTRIGGRPLYKREHVEKWLESLSSGDALSLKR